MMRRSLAVAVVTGALVLGACGGDDSDQRPESTPSTTTTETGSTGPGGTMGGGTTAPPSGR